MKFCPKTWIPWNPDAGLPCPEHVLDLELEVLYRDGSKESGYTGGCWSWRDCGEASIIRYRIVSHEELP